VETAISALPHGRFTSPDPLPWLMWQRGNSKARERSVELMRDP